MNEEYAMTMQRYAIRSDGLLERLWPGRTKYLVGAMCVAICTVMIFPLLVSILASFKTSQEAALVPPTYFPGALTLENYSRLLHYQAGLFAYLGNSFGAAALTIALCLGLTVPAGYALARFSIPGKEIYFAVLLLALMIPYQALLTPIFFMFVQWKIDNTLIGLAIIHTMIQLPFSIYIMRNSFEAVPRELEEAAIMDGCNSWQTLIKIFLPAIRPAIVSVALFAFITSWNEFLGALVIMSEEKMYTLPIMLVAARTANSLGGTDWGMLQAGVVISIVPCVIIYLLLQKYYVGGILSGAVK
jgi:multiple sugar transport system permease protein